MNIRPHTQVTGLVASTPVPGPLSSVSSSNKVASPERRRHLVGRFGAALLAVLCVVAALASSVVAAGPAFAGGPTLIGSGGSYPAVAIDQWVAQVSTLYGDSIDYATTSSVIGLNEFAQKQVDFAGSEIGYSTNQAQYQPARGYAYQYLPDVAGATCLMYNVANRAGQRVTSLRLDSSVMAQIFTGSITKWNDARIAALNPGALLPDSPIVVVFRTDASGENYLFSDYLNHMQPGAWHGFTKTLGFPQAAQAIWPVPQEQGSTGHYDFSSWVGQSGSDNASNYVASSTGTITYVETAYALLHNDPCAAVRNASGHWVEPSEYNDAVALERAQLLPDLEQKLGDVYRNTLPAAYPISAYSYLITPESEMPAQKGAVLGRFIRYLACAGQQAAGQLGYSPLPPNLVEEDFKGISRINGAAAPPSQPTAANCKNPYVDGQTPLPGEPVIGGTGGSTAGNKQSSGGHKAGGDKGKTDGGKKTGTGKSGSKKTGGTDNNGKTGTAGGSKTGTGKANRDGKNSGRGTSSTKAGKGTHSGRGAGKPAARANKGAPKGSGRRSASQQPAVLATGLWPGQSVLGGSPATSLPGGRNIGSALETAGIGLSGHSGPTGAMVGGALAILFLIGLPPVIAAFRRRRRLAGSQAGGEGRR